MLKLQFTDRAKDDLSAIVSYTKQNYGSKQATLYIAGLREQAIALTETPGIGKRRNDLEADLQSFPFKSHVLYYFVDKFSLIVIRVLHKTMEPSEHI